METSISIAWYLAGFGLLNSLARYVVLIILFVYIKYKLAFIKETIYE